MLAGSVAEDLADEYSDVDLIVYFDALPPAEQVDLAVAQIAPSERERTGYGEKLEIDGVECEVGLFLVGRCEELMASVLEQHEVETTVHRALAGLLSARPLYGHAFIEAWQARAAAFPDGLRRTMAEHYLGRQFAYWYAQERLSRRDATLWLHQFLVDSEFNILGILAGVNCKYFSTSQFKRLRRFVESLSSAPPKLADRLDALFSLPPNEAVGEVEQLFAETLDIARSELSGLDTTRLRHMPGERETPWTCLTDA